MNLIPKRKLPQDPGITVFGDTLVSNAVTDTADLTPAHKDATTAVHGVGAGTVAKTSDIPSAGSTPSTQAYGDSAAGGSASTWSKNDHKHGFPAHTATQAIFETGGARALSYFAGSTIYQNTSGKIMLVTVTALDSTFVLKLSAYVMSGTPPTTIVAEHTHTNVTDRVGITFMVPTNYYYKVYASSSDATCTLTYWTEWTIG